MLRYILLLLAAIQIAFAIVTTCNVGGTKYDVVEVISRDVTIIGGGSAGTYASIRLKDLGKTVVVLEKIGRLGGNTETYHDPVTGATIDYGVQYWHTFDLVFNYFKRLNVSVVVSAPGADGGISENINFQTGVLNLTAPAGNLTAALGAYAAQVFKYPYLEYGFDLPDPVPNDLLLPFGQFVQKYDLAAAVPFIWLFTQGIGDILNKPTIYVMKYIGISSLESLQTGFVITAAQDNSLLYESAQQVLGSDVVYNSTILAFERTAAGTVIIVKTPSGLILVESQKLIIAIQPTLPNLSFLDLSAQEVALFRQFTWSQYFTGILRSSGIPSNLSLVNTAANKPFNLPAAPAVYSLSATGVPNLNLITYLSTNPSTQTDSIANIILKQVKNLQAPGKAATKPSFAVKDIHQPFELSVSSEAIADGFYKKLYALQGVGNTWWIGATWHAHDSSLIWRFTEGLLANITA